MVSTTIQETHGALARKRAECLDDFVAYARVACARAAAGAQEVAAGLIAGPRSLVFRQAAGVPSELAVAYALMTGEWA